MKLKSKGGEEHKNKVFQSLAEHTVSIKNLSKFEKNHSLCQNNITFIYLY